MHSNDSRLGHRFLNAIARRPLAIAKAGANSMCYQQYPLANAKFIPASCYILCVQLQGQTPPTPLAQGWSWASDQGCRCLHAGKVHCKISNTSAATLQVTTAVAKHILAMLSARSFRSTAAWHAALGTQQERPFFFSKVLKCTLGATDSKQSYRLHRHRFPRHVFQTPTSYDTTL